MKQEYFDIYNENMVLIGTEPRSKVHKEGYWHKTFQCWFICDEGEKRYILFQKRHADKDTYPNLLDITAAGHLSAGETVVDGIRELKEELGLDIKFEELISIGVIQEKKVEENFIDAEFGNVFLYNCKIPIEEFILQAEEVVGMFKINLEDVIDLFENRKKYIDADGYEINRLENRQHMKLRLSKADFVPHDRNYYKKVFEAAREKKEIKNNFKPAFI